MNMYNDQVVLVTQLGPFHDMSEAVPAGMYKAIMDRKDRVTKTGPCLGLKFDSMRTMGPRVVYNLETDRVEDFTNRLFGQEVAILQVRYRRVPISLMYPVKNKVLEQKAIELLKLYDSEHALCHGKYNHIIFNDYFMEKIHLYAPMFGGVTEELISFVFAAEEGDDIRGLYAV